MKQIKIDLKNLQNSNNSITAKTLDIKNCNVQQLENTIINSIVNDEDKIIIEGDGSCAYRAIQISLGEKEDYMKLRSQVEDQILLDGVSEDIYQETVILF